MFIMIDSRCSPVSRRNPIEIKIPVGQLPGSLQLHGEKGMQHAQCASARMPRTHAAQHADAETSSTSQPLSAHVQACTWARKSTGTCGDMFRVKKHRGARKDWSRTQQRGALMQPEAAARTLELAHTKGSACVDCSSCTPTLESPTSGEFTLLTNNLCNQTQKYKNIFCYFIPIG